MPNRIESDYIVREHQDKLKDAADHSNAEYVTQLEKTSSIMPPVKPFETEKAQDHTPVKEDKDPAVTNHFVQEIKETTNGIEKLDKNNEVKLHLLKQEYEKVSSKLGGDLLSKKDEANLESLLNQVEDKIDLYKSKLKAGSMSGGGGEMLDELADEDGDGEGTGVSESIMDGVKDQVLMAAPGILAGKKEEEEEEEKEEDEREYDQ